MVASATGVVWVEGSVKDRRRDALAYGLLVIFGAVDIFGYLVLVGGPGAPAWATGVLVGSLAAMVSVFLLVGAMLEARAVGVWDGGVIVRKRLRPDLVLTWDRFEPYFSRQSSPGFTLSYRTRTGGSGLVRITPEQWEAIASHPGAPRWEGSKARGSIAAETATTISGGPPVWTYGRAISRSGGLAVVLTFVASWLLLSFAWGGLSVAAGTVTVAWALGLGLATATIGAFGAGALIGTSLAFPIAVAPVPEGIWLKRRLLGNRMVAWQDLQPDLLDPKPSQFHVRVRGGTFQDGVIWLTPAQARAVAHSPHAPPWPMSEAARRKWIGD